MYLCYYARCTKKHGGGLADAALACAAERM